MIHTHLALMSKRDSSDALSDPILSNWKAMDGKNNMRFKIFENDRYNSDGKFGLWATNPAHYMCNAVQILHQAFKSEFSKRVAYSGHETYIFWRNLTNIPSGSPPLATDKKVWTTPTQSLARMETKKTHKGVSYYEVDDSDDEQADIAKTEGEMDKIKTDEAYALITQIVECSCRRKQLHRVSGYRRR